VIADTTIQTIIGATASSITAVIGFLIYRLSLKNQALSLENRGHLETMSPKVESIDKAVNNQGTGEQTMVKNVQGLVQAGRDAAEGATTDTTVLQAILDALKRIGNGEPRPAPPPPDQTVVLHEILEHLKRLDPKGHAGSIGFGRETR
jgi:hypothetical protein